MRQQHDCFAVVVSRRIPKGANQIVGGIRRVDWRGELQPLMVEPKIGRWLVSKELFAIGDGTAVQLDDVVGWTALAWWKFKRAWPLPGPLQPIVEGTNNAIGGAKTKVVLPLIHPASVTPADPCDDCLHLSSTVFLTNPQKKYQEIPV